MRRLALILFALVLAAPAVSCVPKYQPVRAEELGLDLIHSGPCLLVVLGFRDV